MKMSEPVNLFTITHFYGLTKCCEKGLNSFESGRVASVNVSCDGFTLGKVGASMKKNLYDVKVPFRVCRRSEIYCVSRVRQVHREPVFENLLAFITNY